MRAFAGLLEELGYLQGRNRKLARMVRYFRETPDPDRGWALAALTDGVPQTALGRLPLRRMLADLTQRFLDPVLYRLSRDYVGDTAETVALVWPAPAPRTGGEPAAEPPALGLGAIVHALGACTTTAASTATLGELLDHLDAQGRWALLKFIGGAPRVGVSARLAKTALAEAFGRDVAEVEEVWHGVEAPYAELFAWLEGRAARPDVDALPIFRPVMLAHPIEDEDWARLKPDDFAAEWKWDGIRVQISARRGQVRIFSRQGDDISPAFPEIRLAFSGHACVVDGELLVVRKGEVAPFNDLQQRLNRKAVSPRMQAQYPVHVRLYDLLLDGDVDVRPLPFSERRTRLEAWFARERPLLADLSGLVPFETFAELNRLWSATRAEGIEGLMLKRRDGAYRAGRIKGQWFKWKRAPLTLDCVLMYAQRGAGKRSSFYSDYTFGVWRLGEAGGRELVPVGKAYSGFTDEELRRLDKWVRDNTTERFGPVRAVAPGLVLEIAFDAVQASSRHKSGVAMRFPRVHRIRWDKPAAEADTLAAITALLPQVAPSTA
ncbi:MAG: cisplatin damage response ATP-dependent DNA ligase [Hyphomicrobiaceae bacterium]|nr:cisplatin damage response ATP-dependent DNA ligase [Hyphomicrobiaceae bacterium]